jgi:hypothetical protein
MILLVSYLGGQGIYYQRRNSKFTKWSGTSILTIYHFFLVALLLSEAAWVTLSMDALVQLRTDAEAVTDPSQDDPEMSSLELKIAEKFDAFFFGAASQCGTIKYAWFWGFINTRCAIYDDNMSQEACQKCDDYSVTECLADPRQCYTVGETSTNSGCPYIACRRGILQFILDRFPPFSYFVITMVAFQIVLLAANATLICFHRRDTDTEIKAKNGIFAQRVPAHATSQPRAERALPMNHPSRSGTSGYSHPSAQGSPHPPPPRGAYPPSPPRGAHPPPPPTAAPPPPPPGAPPPPPPTGPQHGSSPTATPWSLPTAAPYGSSPTATPWSLPALTPCGSLPVPAYGCPPDGT